MSTPEFKRLLEIVGGKTDQQIVDEVSKYPKFEDCGYWGPVNRERRRKEGTDLSSIADKAFETTRKWHDLIELDNARVLEDWRRYGGGA